MSLEESRYVCLPYRPPPPPLAIYKEQKIRLGRGLIRRSWNREANPVKEYFFYTGLPQKEGEKSQLWNQKENYGSKYVKTSPVVDSVYIFNSEKIWPRTFWTLARLQPRGLNYHPLLSQSPPVMETVNILNAITVLPSCSGMLYYLAS